MIRFVPSLKLTDHSKVKTVNREQLTINRNSTGFTLVELLVVIAILGVLASFTSVTLIGHQKQARDAQRKSDLQQIKRALQSAKNDCKAAAYYPYPAATDITLGAQAYDHLVTDLITKGYVNSYINDPKSKTPPALPLAYAYFATYETYFGNNGNPFFAATFCPSVSSGSTYINYATDDYILRAKLEITTDPDIAKAFNSCPKLAEIANEAGSYYYLSSQPDVSQGYYYVCGE